MSLSNFSTPTRPAFCPPPPVTKRKRTRASDSVSEEFNDPVAKFPKLSFYDLDDIIDSQSPDYKHIIVQIGNQDINITFASKDAGHEPVKVLYAHDPRGLDGIGGTHVQFNGSALFIRRTHFAEQAMDDLYRILKKRPISIHFFHVYVTSPDCVKTERIFFQRFNRDINSLSAQFMTLKQLKVNQLSVTYNGNQEALVSFLQHFEPKTLKTLHIDLFEHDELIQLDQVKEMEQFKQCIEFTTDMMLEPGFLNKLTDIDSINVYAKSMQPKEIIKLIKSYIASPDMKAARIGLRQQYNHPLLKRSLRAFGLQQKGSKDEEVFELKNADSMKTIKVELSKYSVTVQTSSF